jgi:hypothetical protein
VRERAVVARERVVPVARRRAVVRPPRAAAAREGARRVPVVRERAVVARERVVPVARRRAVVRPPRAAAAREGARRVVERAVVERERVPVRARLVEALRVPVVRFRVVERDVLPDRDVLAGIAGSTELGDSSLRSNGAGLVTGTSGDSLGVWGVWPHPS